VVLLIALQRGAAEQLGGGLPTSTTIIDCQSGPAAPAAAAAILGRVIHESAKPGRPPTAYDQWVVHSTAEYAATHLEGEALADEGAVLAEMQAAFLGLLLGGDGSADAGAAAAAKMGQAVVHASVMAWDHASAAPGSRVADAMYRIDPARRAGVCGDFFGETAGVEAAALSGIALGEALAEYIVKPSGNSEL
jgi:predicted NAD/FAD-dependent oxidoreductase